MRFTKTIKKSIGAALAFIMAVTSVPLMREQVLAHAQPPVTNLTVTHAPTAQTGTTYGLSFAWQRPAIGAGSAIDVPNSTFYEMRFIDRTRGGAWTNIGERVTSEDSSFERNNIPMPQFQNSSIYEIGVRAGHRHHVYMDGVRVGAQDVFAADAGAATFLYLTDIDVRAWGTGESLTVSWARPSFMGRDLFVAYNIYFVRNQDGAAFGTSAATAVVGTPELEFANGWYTYTITDNINLEPGYYSVKVEPVINLVPNVELRTGAGPHSVFDEVTNRSYDIIFRPRNYEFVYTNAYVSFTFDDIFQETDDTIRLLWRLPSNFNQPIGRVRRVEILALDQRFMSGQFNPRMMLDVNQPAHWVAATFLSAHVDMGSLILPFPPAPTLFQIKVFMDDGGTEYLIEYSDVWLFVPDAVNFTPTSPTIIQIEDSQVGDLTRLDIWWQAFLRHPHTPEEERDPTAGNLFREMNIRYYVWISDDFDLLQTLPHSMRANVGDITPHNASRRVISVDGRDVHTYGASFDRYVTLDDYGNQVFSYIEGNKLYFIRIEAVLIHAPDFPSEPAFASYFVMPTDPIERWPLMINRLPLRLGDVTTTTIEIEWDMEWHEIWDPRSTAAGGTNDWHSSVALRLNADGTTSLVFGTDIRPEDRERGNGRYVVDLLGFGSHAAVVEALDRLFEGTSHNSIDFPIRFMSLMGPPMAEFEIHVVEYDEMVAFGGFDEYVQMTVAPGNEGLWQTVTGFDPANPTHTITGLTPNTTYLILFRPFININGQIIRAYLPSHLVATTLAVRPPLDITPTVPVLEPVSAHPMSLRVRFQYTEGLMYELRISNTTGDWPTGGRLIVLDDIDPADAVQDGSGRLWYYYTIEGLFPLTLYYIWIRAYADNPGGREFSAWSNMIDMRTTDIEPPIPPQGLGPASELNVNLINRELEQNYRPVGPNHIIIEWLRDVNDPFVIPANIVEDVGVHQILSHPAMTITYMLRFNELRTNRPYFIRAKTVLTVTMTAEGVVAHYQYVVQLSPTSEFLDVVEITVPTDIGPLHPIYTLVRESDWSHTIRLYTGRDDGEFDSNVNPNMFPLPQQDFELIWEWQTQTLTMRFRSNQTGQDGMRDNLVDQRFISMLVQQRIYHYYVDLSQYRDFDVRNGILELPFSIASAFTERGITLHVMLADTSFAFTPGFMQTHEVNALPGFGLNSRVRYIINRNPVGAPTTFDMGTSAASTTRLNVEIVTPVRTLSMEHTARPITVSQRLVNRVIAVDNHVASYAFGLRDHVWQRQNERYDVVLNELSFETNRLGFFTAVARRAPAVQGGDPAARDHMFNVNNQISIRDIGTFVPNNYVSANTLNKFMAAIALNSREVFIYQPLTANERTLLTNAGWIVHGNTVAREEALNSLVMLHETRTGMRVNHFPTPQTSAFPDMVIASPRFQTGMLKAERLGFITGITANPRSPLTYGELFGILDIILS